MSELIKVDFKARTVTERMDLDNPKPAQEWSAAKDPSFKVFVEAMAHICEAADKAGGDWRRMIVTLQPHASDYETCYTIWDQDTLSHEQASDCLMLSSNKVDLSGQAAKEVEPDAVT